MSIIGPRRTATPINMPDGFEAPYDAFEPRFKLLNDLVLVIFGIENRGGIIDGLRNALLTELRHDNGPAVLEHAEVVEGFGPRSHIWFAYWKTQDEYERWCQNSKIEELFEDPAYLEGDLGIWREYCRISLDHNETSFSREENLTGLANFSDALEVTAIHAYWGSMRDRIAAAADDDLPAKTVRKTILPKDTLGKRIQIQAPKNVCLIKTTQDFSLINEAQQDIYRNSVEPALHAGLSYLRDHGEETGCVGMRFVEERTASGGAGYRTVGIGYFASMGHLEEWTHNSDTHNAIMAQFMAMVEQFQGNPGLNLWHEVTVFPAGWLTGDYVNCSPDGTLMQCARI